uniref:Venom protein HGE029 n=1 Tax=Hoffmannihadrurus gertschi TaxID=380989 RepID=NDB2_HOFGE|nr:RecName: Full=Venom protein HGE029; AltName: Full=Non-disulfide-bridged peptide 3.7; Short=NDBP-3.7; Flags: Precursor [Hadrurus gertschi]
MNAKAFLAIFMIALLITDRAEAGWWNAFKSIGKKLLKSKLAKDITKMAKQRAKEYVVKKLNGPPEEEVAAIDALMNSLDY